MRLMFWRVTAAPPPDPGTPAAGNRRHGHFFNYLYGLIYNRIAIQNG